MRKPWTERSTNKSVLDEIRTETSLEGMITKRALTFFGHTMQSSGIEKDVMLGKVEGTRRRGKQRTRWFNSIKEITGMTLYELKENAMNRIDWRMFVQMPTRFKWKAQVMKNLICSK